LVQGFFTGLPEQDGLRLADRDRGDGHHKSANTLLHR
jgi:hypothetical protein